MSDTISQSSAVPVWVSEELREHPAAKALLAWNPQAVTGAKMDRGELTFLVVPEEVRAACKALQAAGYNFFEDMTAVDWFPSAPRFQLSYHLLSHARKERIRLCVMLAEDEPCVESITSVWMGADFYEREVFDLFGIRFEGHPNLRRIMLPDDWDGHPLRKDYPVEGYR